MTMSARPGVRVAACALCALAVAWPTSGVAQSGELRVDLGAARTLPPSGTDAVEASYLLVGLSGERLWSSGSGLGFSLTGGRPLQTAGGDWASAQVVGELWTDRDAVVNLGLGARGYAFRVATPYVYETNTVEVFPQVRLEGAWAAVTVRGELGAGRSEIALHRLDGTVRRGSRDLWHRGVVAEAATPVPSGLITVGAGAYEGAAGTYGRGFMEWVYTGPATVRLSGEVWDTPRGSRYAGGIGVYLSLGGPWSFRADGGQGVPDPLIRAPQGVQGGGLLGLTLLESGAAPDDALLSWGEVGTDGRTEVVFTVAHETAGRLELLGDFTGWEAVPMTRQGDRWTVALSVEPGTHHFGFQADGAWYLPQDAPGRVSDDWGQENATLVVPDAAVTDPADVTREGR